MTTYWTRIYERQPESAGAIRAMIVNLLAPSMTGDDLDDLLQGVGEAVANAIQHGAGLMQVHVELTDHQVTVRVRDSGMGFDLKRLKTTADCPMPSAETGRGLYIMRQVSDSMAAYTGHGCLVSITKSFNGGSIRPRPAL